MCIGQIICDCGRVAEIRQQKRGKQTIYKVCKHCKNDMTKASREMWLASLDKSNSLGVFGEAPEQAAQAPAKTEKSQGKSQTLDDKAWVDDEQNTSPESQASTELENKKSDFGGTLLKGLFVVGAIAGLAFGISQSNIKLAVGK